MWCNESQCSTLSTILYCFCLGCFELTGLKVQAQATLKNIPKPRARGVAKSMQSCESDCMR